MKRAVVGLLAGLFFLLPGLVYSETVMLYTQMQLRNDTADKNVDRFVAIEDGVMAQFFDSGDIIFDAGIPTKANVPRPLAVGAESWAVQQARIGGAAYLLELTLSFPAAPYPALVPTKVHYRFSEVATGRTITEGDVVPNMSSSEVAKEKPYDLCYSVGQEVARNVISDWQTRTS